MEFSLSELLLVESGFVRVGLVKSRLVGGGLVESGSKKPFKAFASY